MYIYIIQLWEYIDSQFYYTLFDNTCNLFSLGEDIGTPVGAALNLEMGSQLEGLLAAEKMI